MTELKFEKTKKRKDLDNLFNELNDPLLYGSALANPVVALPLYLTSKHFKNLLTKKKKKKVKETQPFGSKPIKKQEGGTVTTPSIIVSPEDDVLNKPVSLTNNEPRKLGLKSFKDYLNYRKEQIKGVKEALVAPRSEEEIKEKYPLSQKYLAEGLPRQSLLKELGGYFTPGVTNVMSAEDIPLTKAEIEEEKKSGDFTLGEKVLLYGMLGLDHAGLLPLEVLISPIGAAAIKGPAKTLRTGLRGIRKMTKKEKPKNMTEKTFDNIRAHKEKHPQASDEFKHVELGKSAADADELLKLDPNVSDQTQEFYIRDNQNMYSAAEANVDKLDFGKDGKIPLSKAYKELEQKGTKPKELEDMGLNILRDDAPSHLVTKDQLKELMRGIKPNIDKLVLKEGSPMNLLNSMKRNMRETTPSTTEGIRAQIKLEEVLKNVNTDSLNQTGLVNKKNYWYLSDKTKAEIKSIRDELTPGIIKNDRKAAELKFHINQFLDTWDSNVKNPKYVNRSENSTQLGDDDFVRIGSIGPPSKEIVLPGGTGYRQFSYVYTANKGQNIMRGGHSQVPNEIMFARTTDRITSKNGASSLHSESLQSDLHQAAREFALEQPNSSKIVKRPRTNPTTGKIEMQDVKVVDMELGGGWVDSAKSVKAQKQAIKNIELQKAGKDIDLSQPQITPDTVSSGGDVVDYTTSHSIKMNKPLLEGQFPDAPFKDTRDWLKYIVKDMIKTAVKENKDMVTFTPPEIIQKLENLGGEGIKAYSVTLPRVIDEVLKDIKKAVKLQFPEQSFDAPRYVAHDSKYAESFELPKEGLGRGGVLQQMLEGADVEVFKEYPKYIRSLDDKTFAIDQVAFIDLNNFSKNAITEVGGKYDNTLYQNKYYNKELLKKALLPKYYKGGLISINQLTKSLWQ